MNKYMIVFTLIVIGSYLISYAARNTPIQRLNAFHRPIPNPFGFVIPAAAFTILSGLRNTLGDTETYASGGIYVHDDVLQRTLCDGNAAQGVP